MLLDLKHLNNLILNDTKSFVRQCEYLHEIQYKYIIEGIVARMPFLNIVCVAGPSSSGKTIFSNKLREKLMTHNINSAVVSMDNYFKDKDEIKPLENGKFDYETLDILDVDLFSRDLENISKGIPTRIPRYNFGAGRKERGNKEIQIDDNSIVFVEGIHALNYDKLFYNINKKYIAGIFISAEDIYEYDNGSYTGIDTRLIRRMVRDNLYRSSGVAQTLSMWESVRYGEDNYILPFKKNANFIFNSSLSYELFVLGKHLEHEYLNLSYDEKVLVDEYLNTDVLFSLNSIDDSYVPDTSILNEFIPIIENE